MSEFENVELSDTIYSRNRRDCLLETIDSLVNQSWWEDAAGPWEVWSSTTTAPTVRKRR